MTPLPMWMRETWLPQLKVIQWAGLARARADHVAAVKAYWAACEAKDELIERFKGETAKAEAAERRAFDAGGPPVRLGVTPLRRRKLEIEAANVAIDDARKALDAAVSASLELFVGERWSEAQAAVAGAGEGSLDDLTGEDRRTREREVRALEHLHISLTHGGDEEIRAARRGEEIAAVG